MQKITQQGLLDVVAEFDELGGASLGLVAWELSCAEAQVSEAWAAAVGAGWLAPAERDEVYDERLWRLSATGWRARAARA